MNIGAFGILSTPETVWLSVSLLTFMVTVKYSSNQMNNFIFSKKYQVYRPFTDRKVQKGLYYRPRSVNTDPLGNPEKVNYLVISQNCFYDTTY